MVRDPAAQADALTKQCAVRRVCGARVGAMTIAAMQLRAHRSLWYSAHVASKALLLCLTHSETREVRQEAHGREDLLPPAAWHFLKAASAARLWMSILCSQACARHGGVHEQGRDAQG